MLSMDQLYNFLGWEELPGTRGPPNLRVLGVPPEADQVSGKKTKKLKPEH
jgi:hypothetical protein